MSGVPATWPAVLAAAFALVVAQPVFADETLPPYRVTESGIPDSLTGRPGDPAAGRAAVVDRQNACLLCHSGPFPEQRHQGNLSPDLNGTGNRWSPAELRLRIVDASRLNAATIMPSYYKVDGLVRVGKPWQGKPILTAQQVEDVVAYLTILRGPP